MNYINYYATFIFEVREDNDVEILDSSIHNANPRSYIDDELMILEDYVMENAPKELGIYKRLEYGTFEYSQDYYGEWDIEVNVKHESLTKFTEDEVKEYLKQFE